MPTLGENFGHIFLEALAAGCPLMISDRTPWLELEAKGIGWDLSLDKPEVWIEKLNYCIGLNQISYSQMSDNARQFSLTVLNDKKYEEDTLRILESGLKLDSIIRV
jgi:glycosyltransferase involved in cell wall biosynthesis